ncbi:universal stress protein [Modestobacter sp. VKM Ac-2979]|uniref:universal stress protein n=1 Tax=unclassified Modestobacter TaxID=2643866 RepID=UPI0022AB9128|nr:MULTISPECIES: universal stress protein [unclassified Modestobacter]MCZ2811678.1 universal stress protein [Modestobacter sp. VKM Ac-2979]MCZ2843401.1 universal stress protein [Modestobacter sp. VKM Ac-2980]
METVAYVAIVIALWVLAGLAAVVVLLARQGYRHWGWYLMGAVLGPLFIPIAAERARRDVAVLERGEGSPRNEDPDRLTVVVGVDGSAESDQAVREAGRLFAGGGAAFVLVSVLDPDVAEFPDDPRRRAAHDLLTDRAGWLPEGAVLEIGCGQPARVLLEIARAEAADVLVLGRRGRGFSRRLLGSVAERLAHEAGVPVVFPPAAAGHQPVDRTTGQATRPVHRS